MKKILAIVLSIVMAFSVTAIPAAAVDAVNDEAQTADTVIDDASDVIDSAKDVYDNIVAEDSVAAVNGLFDFAQKLAKAIHSLVHTLSEIFDFNCPFCDEKTEEPVADPYEDYTKASTAEELGAALTQGGNIVITDEIVLKGENSGLSNLSGDATLKSEEIIDLNGQTIINSTTTVKDYNVIFYVGSSGENKGNLTITGNGTVKFDQTVDSGSYTAVVYARGNSKVTIENGTYDATTDSTYDVCVWATGNSAVTINDGTFINGSGDLIYVGGAANVVINGGFFNAGDPLQTLNIRDGETGTITLYGGTFVNYDPTTALDKGFTVAKGYEVVAETQSNGDVWYTVQVNEIDTADDVINALKSAESGETVILAADIEIAGNLFVPVGVTLDGNGHALTKVSVYVNDGATLKNIIFKRKQSRKLILCL